MFFVYLDNQITLSVCSHTVFVSAYLLDALKSALYEGKL